MSRTTTEQPLGHSPEETPQATWRRLDSIAQLLHHAARTVWERADQAGPASPLHSLGLGIYLAHGETQQLLPEDYGHDAPDSAIAAGADTGEEPPAVLELELNHDLDALGASTAVELLTQAEHLSRPLPVGRADLVHGSDLVVDLCDLIREARHLDC